MPELNYNNIDSNDNESKERRIEMTVAQAAQILGVHIMTVGRYLKKGILPYRAKNRRDRFISLDALRQFAADNKMTIDEELVKKILTQ